MLILIVMVLTCVFAYTATKITLPEETVVLLPEDTNFGQVSIALANMDIDESQFGGYSKSTGDSTGQVVVGDGTNAPTRSPVPTPPPTPKPTQGPTDVTANPTQPVPTASPITVAPTGSPTTAMPTPSPTTDSPSTSPTTAMPTPRPTPRPTPAPLNSPTDSPTLRPTDGPSDSPTLRPTVSPSDATNAPSESPTMRPSDAPIKPADPTGAPTGNTPSPTEVPTPVTAAPSTRPTDLPTPEPTDVPSKAPTGETPSPTTDPTPQPTTTEPTKTPTTGPSDNPSTSPSDEPTSSPTTAVPSDAPSRAPSQTPTDPSLAPSTNPTPAPSPYPTFTPPDPDEVTFECINEDSILEQVANGGVLTCSLGALKDVNDANTELYPEQIAFVFEAPEQILYGSDSIAGCNIYNNASVFYNESAYQSPKNWSTKWCYKDTVLNAAEGVRSAEFSFVAPYISGNSWFRVSLWLFVGEWQIFPNIDGNQWYNYSVVNELSAAAETLSVDESISIWLLFGTQDVSDYTTDCESGEVTSGTITFDPNFNIYSTTAQRRWIDLCDALNEITDNVMYRDDEDQSECFSYRFWEYTKNDTSDTGTDVLPNINTPETFNEYIVKFIKKKNSNGFSNDGYDPSKFKSWFGTANNATWDDSNATIRWVHQIVQTQINEKWGGPKMWEYYTKWQDFMDKFNAGSPASFQGVQTSGNYIRMEVEVAFLDGFVKSVLYTIILCAIVMVFFTQNIYLVVLVCLYILIICIWVVGLFGAVGWPFGIIEIISVPTVVGLTIDYALHITHAYIHSPFPDRLRRAKSAVNDLGSSVFASAMTTISSMLILYFATIVIFSDLGWVVGSTTTFGVVLALFVCPPCLMYTGPEYDQCHFTWCCPADKNGIECGGHSFCSNEWHGNKKGIAKEHNEAIELEVQHHEQELISNDVEGTGAPGGYDDNANIESPGSIPPQQQDNNMEEELPNGWRACLTDDGKVYYQNDITQETSWKKPEDKKEPEVVMAVQASAPSEAYEQAENARPLQTAPVQSEPDDDNDLPPSYNEAVGISSELPGSYQPPSANLEEVEQAQLANAEPEPELASSDKDDDDKVNDAVDDLLSGAYLIPPTKGNDDDATKGTEDEQKSINQVYDEQANILQQVGSGDDDDEDGYVPPAPAPPAAYAPGQEDDDDDKPKEDLMAKMATPNGDGDEMNLEESLSLPMNDGDNNGGDIL